MASLSRDGRTLAVVSEHAGAGLLVDLADDSVRAGPLAHPRVNNVALSPDGRWLATSGHHSDRVRLWDVETGKLAQEWANPSATQVFFAPDSRSLVIGRTGDFRFYDVKTFQPIRELPRDGPVYPGCVAFSPDGGLMGMEITPGVIDLKAVATGKTV